MNSNQYIDYLESYIKCVNLAIHNIKESIKSTNQCDLSRILNNAESIKRNSIICYVLKYFYKKQCNNDILIDYLAIRISHHSYLDFLNDIYNESEEGNEFKGYLISNNFYEDDEEYFGKNKIKFYFDVGKYKEEILTYSEFYEYIKIACDFYISLYPDEQKEVLNILEKIKIKYLVTE